MEEQEKIVRELFENMESAYGQGPKEVEPREGEKYRFIWKLKTNEDDSVYGLYQMGDWIYIRGLTIKYGDSEESKIYPMMNELNDICHYSIVTGLPDNHRFAIEQNHFCRSNSLSVDELWHLFQKCFEDL